MSVAGLVTDGPLLLATPVAAVAGLLSFFSPCVLPLVPGYLSYVTGLSGADLEGEPRNAEKAVTRETAPAEAVLVGAAPAAAARPADASVPVGAGSAAETAVPRTPAQLLGAGLGRARRVGRVTVGTGLFVLGFSAVFVSYGVAFGGVGSWIRIHQVGVTRVLGVVTILMGLLFAGAFSRFMWANRELRLHRLPSPGLLGAPLLGVLFGLGWTPCLGPTLTAVLGLAVQSATAGRGAFLSAVYCLGLGVPFVVVGLGFRRAAGALVVVRSHARLLTLAGGTLLVVVGVLQVTGQWADLVSTLRSFAPGFAETPL
ncbi:cytochrome c biogenesis protein CcdA [Frankia sp. AgB1.9]|uniref:cytochrome c biogenesis CcdA family protein n=1 Tax=unclassified Frankia TaxID=2632575 RepID=UPI001932B467|nr:MULTISPECIES: cytochrome c biogenesis protein CcdA [unclassified Frankia]MBL7488450.1 cytochrome c biogenesis protein CcdA [Frankia sp. AgW1.1]MBL7550138.1 cytochrome c biogenesis protein CcdA [Frankia sp. AgB1.9]MBL7625011.1 cytochrome c biogenesis protein CcdA [Frankia sp. AgB1.8]